MSEDVNSLLWRISELDERPYNAPWNLRFNYYMPTQPTVLRRARRFAVVRTSSVYDPYPARYEPDSHSVHVPPAHAFSNEGQYAGVLLHELAHWTMKPLKRPQGNACRNDWHREELVAETTSRLMLAHLGFEVSPWSDHYLRGHLGKIDLDKHEVFEYVEHHVELATALLKERFDK